MIRINLLPFRTARKKENVRQQISVFILALIFLTLGMSYLATVLDRKIHDVDSRIKTATQQLNELTVLTKEIAEIKQKLGVIKKKNCGYKKSRAKPQVFCRPSGYHDQYGDSGPHVVYQSFCHQRHCGNHRSCLG
jgi:cell division protein FtsB